VGEVERAAEHFERMLTAAKGAMLRGVEWAADAFSRVAWRRHAFDKRGADAWFSRSLKLLGALEEISGRPWSPGVKGHVHVRCASVDPDAARRDHELGHAETAFKAARGDLRFRVDGALLTVARGGEIPPDEWAALDLDLRAALERPPRTLFERRAYADDALLRWLRSDTSADVAGLHRDVLGDRAARLWSEVTCEFYEQLVGFMPPAGRNDAQRRLAEAAAAVFKALGHVLRQS
jgi:hypothetical protein